MSDLNSPAICQVSTKYRSYDFDKTTDKMYVNTIYTNVKNIKVSDFEMSKRISNRFLPCQMIKS